MILYSMDYGATWYKSTDFNQSVVQFTQVVPLRNCVLFLSDARLTGIARYNRPSCGTLPNNKIHFDIALLIQEEWGKSSLTEVPIGSTPFVDYGNSKAYFGFATVTNTHNDNTTNELKYGEIFTTDGYTFKKVFSNDNAVQDGVISVFGDFKNKKAMVN